MLQPAARPDQSLEIVMATYQGERFLDEQLRSIERQTMEEWSLIARDDGSTDRTVRILEEFAARHPARVTILRSDGRRLGPAGNFSSLLAASTADFLVLADQDDVWTENKLSVLMEHARKQRRRDGGSLPFAVHSDLEVVDASLRTVAPSFVRYQGLEGGLEGPLPKLLVQNHVTGCSLAVNRALIELALPIPSEAVMHDAWLALVAAAFGRISFEPLPLVRYRQHGASQVGAVRYSWNTLTRKATNRRSARSAIGAKIEQAHAFSERFGSDLGVADCRALTAFLKLPSIPLPSRWRVMRREGLVASDPWRTLGLVLLA